MSFHFKLWPTILTSIMLFVLVALGSWQIQRLNWKNELITKIQTRAAERPVLLAKHPDDMEELEFQRVNVRGRFDHSTEFHLVNRSLNGNPGLHIITPFLRSDNSGVLLVNRGWVPFEKKNAKSRREGLVAGEIELNGIIRLIKGPGAFTPKNDPGTNHWFFIDPVAKSKISGHSFLTGFYLLDGNVEVPGGFPVGHQWTLDIRNDHLQYAITWYSLAFALLVIFFVYHRQKD